MQSNEVPGFFFFGLFVMTIVTHTKKANPSPGNGKGVYRMVQKLLIHPNFSVQM